MGAAIRQRWTRDPAGRNVERCAGGTGTGESGLAAEPAGARIRRRPRPRSPENMKKARIAMTLGALLSVLAWACAAWAWKSHHEWMRTGAYARNSFPMNQLARDATLAAAGLSTATIALAVWTARRGSENGSGR